MYDCHNINASTIYTFSSTLPQLSNMANCEQQRENRCHQHTWPYIKRTKRHTNTHTLSIPFLSSIFWNFIHFAAISLNISIFSFISLPKSLYLDNTYYTHYYPSLPHFNILKLYHFAAQKHISIFFSISLTITLFLKSNITNVITQKQL